MSEQKEMVNHPSHYNMGGIECVDAVKAMLTGWTDPWLAANAFQVVKYIWRCPFKENTLQDLEKARFYLDEMIEHLENLKYNKENSHCEFKTCKHAELTSQDYPCCFCQNNKIFDTEKYKVSTICWEKKE